MLWVLKRTDGKNLLVKIYNITVKILITKTCITSGKPYELRHVISYNVVFWQV